MTIDELAMQAALDLLTAEPQDRPKIIQEYIEPLGVREGGLLSFTINMHLLGFIDGIVEAHPASKERLLLELNYHKTELPDPNEGTPHA